MYGNGSRRRISREAAALSAVAEREGGGGRPENPEEFGPNPIGIINFLRRRFEESKRLSLRLPTSPPIVIDWKGQVQQVEGEREGGTGDRRKMNVGVGRAGGRAQLLPSLKLRQKNYFVHT